MRLIFFFRNPANISLWSLFSHLNDSQLISPDFNYASSMSVTIKHLNADTSFLLTFSPHPPSIPEKTASSQSYTILIDPWLVGPSVVCGSWFALSHHTIPACISHLSEIPEPDLVIISQNKCDHCHEATLRQLPQDTKALIVAEPAAARTIRGFNHFKPSRIIALRKYSPERPSTVFRFSIPALVPEGQEGEVTISFIPARNYATGVHNAIGITYRAPTALRMQKTQTVKAAVQSSSRNCALDRVLSPGLSKRLSPSTRRVASKIKSSTSTSTSTSRSASRQTNTKSANSKKEKDVLKSLPPIPPEKPKSTSKPNSNIPAATTIISPMKPLPKPPEQEQEQEQKPPPSPPQISILYTPHGIPLTPDLQPYIKHHLRPRSLLPLTLLLHSLNRSHNPWYLGGTITAGANGGGVDIARALKARYWIGAHDEEKENKGCGVKLLRTERSDIEEVRRAVEREHSCCGVSSKKDGEKEKRRCEVMVLDVGEEVVLSG